MSGAVALTIHDRQWALGPDCAFCVPPGTPRPARCDDADAQWDADWTPCDCFVTAAPRVATHYELRNLRQEECRMYFTTLKTTGADA